MKKFILALSLTLTAPVLASGCTPAQAANAISTIDGYVQYVTSFVSVAQGIWAVISPLLGTSVAPAANAQFAKGITDVNDAAVALEDALSAARIANNPSPNVAAFVAQCTFAVDEVVAAISQYSTPSTSSTRATTSLSTLQHMQSTMHAWAR
jgi:hypothetical protein